jgi:LacI family transcriptional regulator
LNVEVDDHGDTKHAGDRGPTMSDVARLAGVSLKTVSRVFNGVKSVDERYATKVFAAADELAFIPNMAAQTLRKKEQRTYQVATIFTDPNNPFLGTLLSTLQRVAHESDTLVLAATTGKQTDLEPNLVRAFATRRVDGIIMSPTSPSQAYLQPRVEAGLPIVCIDRAPVDVETDVVMSSNRLGARDAVQHLLAHGHRRIAYMGDLLGFATAKERHQGYVDAMEAAGAPIDPSWVVDDLRTSWQSEAAVLDMFGRDDPPTALFTSQNLVTIGALEGLRTLGLRGRVAHVGFDDVPLAALLDPPLTVVAQDLETMAETAMNMLLARIEDRARPVRRVTVPTKLIRRGSGELPAPVPTREQEREREPREA